MQEYLLNKFGKIALLVCVLYLMSFGTVRAQSQWTTDANGNITNTNNGNVGVGTSNPGEKLVTFGSFLVGNINNRTPLYGTFLSQNNVVMELGYGSATSSITPLPIFTLSKNLTSLNNPIGIITFANSNIANGSDKRLGGISTYTDGALNSGALLFLTSSAGTFAERMRITSAGNVGIGTTTPAKKLHLFGANSQLYVDRSANTSGNYALVNFATNGIQKFLIGMNSDSDPNLDKLSFFDAAFSPTVPVMTLTGGRIGIGTTNPLYKLDIVGEIRSSGGFRFPDGTVQITAAQSTALAANISAGQFGQNTGGGNYTFPGNVTVNGTINAGTINAKYQDVAEWVATTEKLPAGTVVVLDPSRSNQVISSTVAYDTRVAGIVSDQPGIALGEGGDGRVLVATTGRVRVKVDASKYPIRIGDLLVTSGVRGVAMRSRALKIGNRLIHQPGTIIGKALEPLEKGSGEILVLLSLQ